MSPQAAHTEGAGLSAATPGCILTATGLPYVLHPTSRKPSLPVMVPPPSREHLSASSSNPPSSGHECRLCFLQKVLGQGWNRATPAPAGHCPLSGESARKPSSVWTKTLYPMDPAPLAKGAPPAPVHPALKTLPADSTGARGDARSWSSGSALGFCLLGQVKPSGLGSPLPMSPRPQKAVSQTEPSLPTSLQEGGSGRELSAPAWPPEASPPKPPSPANPVRRTVCQAMPLGTSPPQDARPLASFSLSSSRTLGRKDACQRGHGPTAVWLGSPARSPAHCPMLPPARESPEDRTQLLRRQRPRASPSGDRATARQGPLPAPPPGGPGRRAWRAQGPGQPGKPDGGLRTHPGPSSREHRPRADSPVILGRADVSGREDAERQDVRVDQGLVRFWGVSDATCREGGGPRVTSQEGRRAPGPRSPSLPGRELPATRPCCRVPHTATGAPG